MPHRLRITDSGRHSSARPLRNAVDTVVMVLIVLSLVATWHLQWFIVPSGSMADALVGTHRDFTCPDCGRSFACGADEPDMPGKLAVCPNCGSASLELDQVAVANGDRLLVDRTAFTIRSPRRWELAAFRDKSKASQVVVKRIAGLPGETIEVRSGDIYADGQIQRKTLAELRAVAIVVHDADFQPSEPGLPDRWQGETGVSQWRGRAGKYVIANREGGTGTREPRQSAIPTDWLEYHHWRRRPGHPHESEETPIDDGYGYNQTRPVVDSFPVSDLLLACTLRTSGSGRLALVATDGQSEFMIKIDPAMRCGELFRDAQPVETLVDLPRLDADEVSLELALVDQQVLLAIAGQTVLAYPYLPGDRAFRPTPRPLKIGSQRLGIELSQVRLYRDVYYTPPRDRAAQYRLADDEYFMLGDNSPLSLDSRDWAGGAGVPRRLLLGRPFFVHYASRSPGPAKRAFQVPDLTRIRYIR
jgi:signal peptidase I